MTVEVKIEGPLVPRTLNMLAEMYSMVPFESMQTETHPLV